MPKLRKEKTLDFKPGIKKIVKGPKMLTVFFKDCNFCNI